MQPKSEIFVGYSEDVKGYRLIEPHSHDIIIRRDVKFYENLLACEPDSTFVPSSSSSSSNFLDMFPTLVFDDDSEDENQPSPAHVPLVAPAPLLPQWVRSTCESASDPRDQHRTRSQFQ